MASFATYITAFSSTKNTFCLEIWNLPHDSYAACCVVNNSDERQNTRLLKMIPRSSLETVFRFAEISLSSVLSLRAAAAQMSAYKCQRSICTQKILKNSETNELQQFLGGTSAVRLESWKRVRVLHFVVELTAKEHALNCSRWSILWICTTPDDSAAVCLLNLCFRLFSRCRFQPVFLLSFWLFYGFNLSVWCVVSNNYGRAAFWAHNQHTHTHANMQTVLHKFPCVYAHANVKAFNTRTRWRFICCCRPDFLVTFLSFFRSVTL